VQAHCALVDIRQGADCSEVGKSLSLRHHEGDGGQVGLDGQDRDEGCRETVGGSPLQLVPEGVES